MALGPVRRERCYRRATQIANAKSRNATDETPLLHHTLTNRYNKQSVKLRWCHRLPRCDSHASMRVKEYVLARTTPDYLWLPSPEGADLRRLLAGGGA